MHDDCKPAARSIGRLIHQAEAFTRLTDAELGQAVLADCMALGLSKRLMEEMGAILAVRS